VEKRNATRRTIVSANTIRAAVQKLRLGDVAEREGDIITWNADDVGKAEYFE
jgi:hypothetical protein